MSKKIVSCVVLISYAHCADHNSVPKYDMKKVYRPGVNVHALRTEAIRNSLKLLADQVEHKDLPAQEATFQIERFLSLVPMPNVCIESLTTIVCVFAQQGCINEVRQIFDAIKKCDDNSECINEIAGTVLVKIKKQELENKSFFSKKKAPVNPALAEIRKIAELYFKPVQRPSKKVEDVSDSTPKERGLF